MADNILESEPFASVEFLIKRTSGHVEIIKLDVGAKSPLIGGHKQDLAEMFNLEGLIQTWKYNDKILDDEKSLWDYGINGLDIPVITIDIS